MARRRSKRQTRGQGWELISAPSGGAKEARRRRDAPPADQKLLLCLERRGGGKVVTVARGFSLTPSSLKALAKELKVLSVSEILVC